MSVVFTEFHHDSNLGFCIFWGTDMTISDRLAAKAKQENIKPRTIAKFDYPVHSVSELFPAMDAESYAALKDDIAAHGQAEPIVLWKKQLIDGRHRLQACNELGIKPVVVDIADSEDPLAYVISHNLHRRHLTESQRSMVAAKVTTMKVGRPSEKGPIGPIKTQLNIEDSAKALNVSPRSVKRAKQVIEHGAKAVQKAVEQGKLAVSTAAELATSGATKAEQTQAVKDGKEAIKGVLKKPAKKEKAPLSKEEQIKANRKLAKDYIAKAVNAVDDYHHVKPDARKRADVIKLLQQAGGQLW